MTPSARRLPAAGPGASPGPRARLQVEVIARGIRAAAGLGPWLAGVAPARARGEIVVAVVSDATVRRLNRRYRGKSGGTDVLAFPSGEPGSLGDVVISQGVAERQARRLGHAVGIELRVLALHGMLHLLGYDHETDDGRMGRVERRLRRRGGLAEGLIERG
ncbi:MAG: rRNA maturation RNase YbeY [Vicinamibacterales bacterium]